MVQGRPLNGSLVSSKSYSGEYGKRQSSLLNAADHHLSLWSIANTTMEYAVINLDTPKTFRAFLVDGDGRARARALLFFNIN